MNEPDFKVRRATLDDMEQITRLWQSMHFPVEDLARRVTEFQVAENAEGKLVGALGLQLAERQGYVHSECFEDFSLADKLRPLLWERLNSLAANHGLWRLWTSEKAPFWQQTGMAKPDQEALSRLPMLWRSQSNGWLTIKLKEDVEIMISLDKEFAMFMESEKQRTQRAFEHAKILKAVATIIALILLMVVFAGAFYFFKHSSAFHR